MTETQALQERVQTLERSISHIIPFLRDLETKANLHNIADYLREIHWVIDDLEFVLSQDKVRDQ